MHNGTFLKCVKWGYRCKFTRNWGRYLDFSIFGCFSPLPPPRFFPCKGLWPSVTGSSCSVGSYCLNLYLVVYFQPENIMLLKPKSKKIKLIDFGLSRKLREDEIVKEMMGTPEFVGESNTALVHASMCSVTMSWFLFAKSLTALSERLVTMISHLQWSY